MKKRRIASLAAALCLVLSMVFLSGTDVSAAITPNSTQTVIVENLKENTTVSAYQVITLNVTSGGGLASPLYQWDSDVQSWVRANFSTYIAADGSVTDTFINMNTDASKTFWEALAKGVSDGNPGLTADKTASSGTSTSASLSNMGMGGYLLCADVGNNVGVVAQPCAVNVLPSQSGDDYTLAATQTVPMKLSGGTFEKTVSEITTGVGKVLTYQVKHQILTYPENVDDIYYVIGDRMGTGLTYNKGTVVVSFDKNQAQKVPDDAYTLDEENVASGFEATFDKDFLLDNGGRTLYVTYQATVNKDAVKVSAVINDVELEYNPDPYNIDEHNTWNDRPEVYTYDIDIFKQDASTNAALSGAKFTLSDNTGKLLSFTEESNNTYIYDATGTASGAVTELEIKDKAALKIQGLDTGVYKLKETFAPDGYVLPSGEVTITLVDETGDEGKSDGKLDSPDTKIEASGTYTIANVQLSGDSTAIGFEIKNSKPGDLNLPVTGGMGTFLFTAAGIAVMGGAVLLFVWGRKRNRAK